MIYGTLKKVKQAATKESELIYRTPEAYPRAPWQSKLSMDIDQIMHCPYFSRYADKTQVFALFKNDDVTRRSLHVQLVSRIARSIGKALGLNLELIEAISLGHDLGHPAFAHSGEKILNKLYHAQTGKYFLHNIQSVRVLDKIHGYRLSLQTLMGIAAHNGEMELLEYRPVPVENFTVFDGMMARCESDKEYAAGIMPNTLEGAVVRISDIIAYLGKDRQDAVIARAVEETEFSSAELGLRNAEIVKALVGNIIENSKGKPYIKLDSEHFEMLKRAKKENYEKIYDRAESYTGIGKVLEPMMAEIYGQLLDDLKSGNTASPVFTHHIRQVNEGLGRLGYEKTEPNRLVTDYIASMTDDYLIELHGYLFKGSPYQVKYRGYFDEE